MYRVEWMRRVVIKTLASPAGRFWRRRRVAREAAAAAAVATER